MSNSRNGNVTINRVSEYEVAAKNADGLEVRARLVQLTRHLAVIEIFSPDLVLRASETLLEFTIKQGENAIYSGRGLIASVVHVGGMLVCEIKLTDDGFQPGITPGDGSRTIPGNEFEEFLTQWQKSCRIIPEYKLVVGDMFSFFSELRYWLNRVELDFGKKGPGPTGRTEAEVVDPIARKVIPIIDDLFVRFEAVVEKLPLADRAAHGNYMRQQLHPLVLCSPFAHRTYTKPLGYAGDYEMINMIARNGYEGASLFAKVINRWFVEQPPATAHRNRLIYLAERIVEESLRGVRESRPTRILNIACGPAWEVQGMLSQPEQVKNVIFTLLDFNEETLSYTKDVLNKVQRRAAGGPQVNYIKKSVHHLLVEASRNADPTGPKYDFVYCAGLFDYLTDQVCHRLLNLMYEWVAPGGLVIATNVEPSNPLKHGMDHLLEWHLAYRQAPEFRALAPKLAHPDDVRVFADITGVNIFLEARKPHGG